MSANWGGVEFQILHHRDGRMMHASGLFAFVRRGLRDGPLMLFAGEAEDLAQVAGPRHPLWADALQLGMDELHVRLQVNRRIDRLQLVSRVVRHVQPLLNVLEEGEIPLADRGRRRA